MDIIIISASRNEELKEITQHAINTCYQSKGDFNIVVVETFKKYNYKNAKVIEFIEKSFNYNRTVNYALSKTNSKWVGIFNNDIEFTEDWYIEISKYFDKYQSLSPRCMYFNKTSKGAKQGYKLREHLNGWAIILNRSILKKIGKFNEDVSFWRSDDIYAQQLKKAGIKHALISDSIVNHLHGGSKTLHQSKDQNRLTHEQYNVYKDIDVHNYTFSIIMPSYLGEYKWAAKYRDKKIVRAIKSVINQTFKNWELIIVADGCQKTVDIVKPYLNGKIKCFHMNKQPYMSGNVRQIGIDNATGKYIIYLDNDDMYGPNHLKFVKDGFKDNDWVYFDDIYYNGKQQSIKKVTLDYGVCGTSSISHKRLLDASWKKCDGYGHDWRFIEKLKGKHKHIGTSEYLICHTAKSNLDYHGEYNEHK
jgi:glycosyltransferase involved in cell wall biosynthesis